MRGGRIVRLKEVVDEALKLCSCVQHVVLFRKSGGLQSFVRLVSFSCLFVCLFAVI